MIAVFDGRTAAEACRMEHEILEHIKAALRVTLDWQAPGVGLARKLSSVRFTLKSFERHLDRVMALEEEGGYLCAVAECKPNLHERAETLRAQHDLFREQLATIVIAAEKVDDYDATRICAVCNEVALMLAKIDKHDRNEIDLIQEALLRDEGGEG